MGEKTGFSIVPLNHEGHLPKLVEILERMNHSNLNYPPPRGYAAFDGDSIKWLTSGGEYAYFVAILDGEPVGCVRLSSPRDYLTVFRKVAPQKLSYLPGAEMQGLIVDPRYHRKGIAQALVDHCRAHAKQERLYLMLAVLHTSLAAENLYRKTDLISLGTFVGDNGPVQVFGENPNTLAELTRKEEQLD